MKSSDKTREYEAMLPTYRHFDDLADMEGIEEMGDEELADEEERPSNAMLEYWKRGGR